MSSDNHQEGRLVYNSIMRNREAPVKSDDHAQKKKVSFDTEALGTAVHRKNYPSKYRGRSHIRWGAKSIRPGQSSMEAKTHAKEASI